MIVSAHGLTLRTGRMLMGASVGALAIAIAYPAAAQTAPAEAAAAPTVAAATPAPATPAPDTAAATPAAAPAAAPEAAPAPAAAPAAQQTDAAPGPQENTGGNEIVVTGRRAAERAAIELKKDSDQVSDSIVADDVGKLPDQNVAEAVRRLPGLSVANDQGEGRYVIIRGVNPNLVNVTVNGQTQPAPEPDGRQVKLDDIPSSLIGSVTISKSITPDQDANAIGGAVDIRTLSAFDRTQHFFATARGQYGWYKLNGKSPYEGDATVGGRIGDLGIVASGSYSYRPIESENFQGGSTFDSTGRPDQYGLRDYNLVRKRTGFVLNLDYRPSDAVKLFLRGTYSKFSDNEFRDQNRVDSFTYTGGATGTFTGRPSILIRRRIEDDNTKSVSGGGSFKFGDSQLDIAGAWASAVKDDPLRSEFNFRGNTNTSGNNIRSVAGTYDITTAPYTFVVNPPFATNYLLSSVNYDKRHAQEDLWQIRVDYTIPIGIGDRSTIKIGGKYLNRHKTNDRNYQAYSLAANQQFTAANASYVGDTDFYNGMYAFGPRIDYDAAQAYVVAHPGVLAQSVANLQSSRANSLVNDYDVTEKIIAGYAMATLKFGGLTLIPGVRVERTQDYDLGKVITPTSLPTEDFNSIGKRSYTDWFPGVTLKYEATKDLIFRAAVTTSLGRPNYPDLTPFVSVDATTSPTTVTLGNPDIKPYRALNLDLTAEYYLGQHGIISVGAFYKRIDNPIYSYTQTLNNVTYAGQTFATANVVQPVNADQAIIKGIEFNAQYTFDFLPGPLAGLGIGGNYTIVGGHGTGLPGRTGEFPLFFQSSNIGSVQLTYEKYGISARVAYSFRAKYLDTIGTSAATDQYTDFNGQLDARLGVTLKDHVELYIEGSNLNDAPWRRFMGVKSQLLEREHYGRLIKVGAQIKF